MPDVPSLEDLVRAICEGTPVDWESLARDASPGFGHKLAALRLVESVARVHRRVPQGDQASPAVTSAPLHWGHLELIEHIASGAFGDVYRAWDPGLDREVALKLLKSADADVSADEAVDEGRLLARLHHPNIVTVYGAARHDGRVGLWMEYVRGRTLADVVREDGPMPVDRVASIGIALCDALGAVHAARLVHRDIKGQNVMLTAEQRVVLMDFGAGRDRLHAALDLVGTPAYLAPEVASGREPTARSDIYSLGILLRYLATGTLDASEHSRPTDKRTRRLFDILRRASAADPAARFESAQAVRDALSRLITQTAFSRRRLLAIAATLAAGLVLVVASFWQSSHPGGAPKSEFERRWHSAKATRAPLTADQLATLLGTSGTFAADDTLPSTTKIRADMQHSLLTTSLRTSETREWISYSLSGGHEESVVAATDHAIVVYVWVDEQCQCASLRTVDRAGAVRRWLEGPDIVGLWIGASTSRAYPVLIARKTGRHELLVVDTVGGSVVRTGEVTADPNGFGLSPDGRFLAFDAPHGGRQGNSRDIEVRDVATGRQSTLLEDGGDRVLPVWAPRDNAVFYLQFDDERTDIGAVPVVDGRAVAPPTIVTADVGNVVGLGFVDAETLGYWPVSGPSDVMVVEADDAGSFKRRTPRRISHGLGSMPAWSADGRLLAWSWMLSYAGEIRISDSRGRTIRRIQPRADVGVFPAWSPDSRRLAYWRLGRLTRAVDVVDVESGDIREVLREPHPQIGGEFGLTWLPGGREVIFNMDPATITAIDVKTGVRRQIYSASPLTIGTYFYVSPDGHSLAFGEGDGAKGRLRIVPLDTAGRSVTGTKMEPDWVLEGWCADGRSVLESRTIKSPNEPDSEQLCCVPLDGSPMRQIGVSGAGMYYASVSPDGTKVAYSTAAGGQALWLLKPSDAQ
jgi:serine/threonine protein kinase/Tol biopolymer transport system component